MDRSDETDHRGGQERRGQLSQAAEQNRNEDAKRILLVKEEEHQESGRVLDLFRVIEG